MIGYIMNSVCDVDKGSGFVVIVASDALELAVEKIKAIKQIRDDTDEARIERTTIKLNKPYMGIFQHKPFSREQVIAYLDKECSIFGWRSTKYTNAENRLIKVELLCKAAIINKESDFIANEWLAAALYRHEYIYSGE